MTKKKNRGLTGKQYEFIYAILVGKTRADAYRLAYDTSKMKQQSIHSNAYKLFNDGLIQEEYKRLLQEQNNEALEKWGKGRVVQELNSVVELAKDSMASIGLNKTNTEALLKAIDRLADLTTISAKDHVKLALEVEKEQREVGRNKLADAAKKMAERQRGSK